MDFSITPWYFSLKFAGFGQKPRPSYICRATTCLVNGKRLKLISVLSQQFR